MSIHSVYTRHSKTCLPIRINLCGYRYPFLGVTLDFWSQNLLKSPQMFTVINHPQMISGGSLVWGWDVSRQILPTLKWAQTWRVGAKGSQALVVTGLGEEGAAMIRGT